MNGTRINVKKIVLYAFVITTAAVATQWSWVQITGNEPFKSVMVILWSSFYISCLLVTIYGSARSAGLEGTVYCLVVFAEAFAPGLCERLILRLPNVAIEHAVLAVTTHLTLTLAACFLLAAWGCVLIYTRMSQGKTPPLASLYLIVLVLAALIIIIWAAMNPAYFIGLEAAKNGIYIRGLWPPMYASPMSYARIILALLSLFLPWVRGSMDNN